MTTQVTPAGMSPAEIKAAAALAAASQKEAVKEEKAEAAKVKKAEAAKAKATAKEKAAAEKAKAKEKAAAEKAKLTEAKAVEKAAKDEEKAAAKAERDRIREAKAIERKAKADAKAAAKLAKTVDKYSEDDIITKVEAINKLLITQETSSTKNDWKLGKLLVSIRTNVADGTWNNVCTSMIHGVAGRKLCTSSIQKKQKLYNAFPKDEKRAVDIGVGRWDQICRIKTQADREELLKPVNLDDPNISGGIIHFGTGVPTAVEDMTVRDLKESLDKILVTVDTKTPQEKFTAAFSSKARAVLKLLEDYATVIEDETFAIEHGKLIKASLDELVNGLKSVKKIKFG